MPARPVSSLVLTLCILSACAAGKEGKQDAGPVEPPFSFAILADSHLTSDEVREARLAQLVRWLNAEAAARHIELVLILGDIGWGEGVQRAHDVLSELQVPWIPLIGDNEVVFGAEDAFESIFGPHLEAVSQEVHDLRRAPRPVHLVVPERDAAMQNFAFTWRGVRFVALDWASRQEGELVSELGELHPEPGGTLDWLKGEISGHPEARGFVLASHLPMHDAIFEPDELRQIAAALEPRRNDILATIAGHMHVNYEVSVDPIYDVWVTAATWGDTSAIRLGHIEQGPEGTMISQELVDVPF